jgi:pyridoxine 5-phosphate synthase
MFYFYFLKNYKILFAVMTKLSVNINKIATLRNARGGNIPNVIKAAIDIERFGAYGITVHPRPDERHITYNDVRELKKVLTTEFNIEGNPREQKFMDLVLEIKPEQVTLVPDSQLQITSDHGWDTKVHKDFLKETIAIFKKEHIRTSIFVDPVIEIIREAKETGTDRIELYTEKYAQLYSAERSTAVKPFKEAAIEANDLGLGINAGHDLNLENLKYFKENVTGLLEVSIGHALISDALYFGLENTVQMYLRQLR